MVLGIGGPKKAAACGERYDLDLSFIAFTLAFTSFFTNVTGIGLSIGKLTMAFVIG
jgi:hypothetical protein